LRQLGGAGGLLDLFPKQHHAELGSDYRHPGGPDSEMVLHGRLRRNLEQALIEDAMKPTLSFVGIPTLLPITSAPPPSLQWSFTLAVPLSRIKDTITTLTTVQQNTAKKNNGLSVTFQVQGSQVSPQALQSQACALPDLIADARAQAQKLADAAGMGVGVILAMSGATSVPTATTAGLSSFLIGVVPLSNCALTVKFALQRF